MPVFAEQKETSTSVLDRRLSVSELQQQQQQQQGASSDRLLASKEELLNGGSNGAAQQEVEAQIKTQQQQEQLQYEQQQQQQQQQSPPSSTAMPTASTSQEPSPSLSSSAPQEETMIFFDWDDTLLSSTFLASHGYRLDTDLDNKEGFVELMLPELKQLETCVVNVLSEALQRGRVHIITNAEHGWVELSAQKFIPGVLPYLQQVTVISARSTYEHMFPEAPLKWKFSAFQDRLSAFFALEGVTRNILSFGDSHVEREAVRTVTRGVENTKTKSIKFTESPTIDQLRKQLELVTSHFHYLHTHEGDLDLMLKMSPVPSDHNGSA